MNHHETCEIQQENVELSTRAAIDRLSNQVKSINGLHFFPWVGERYGKGIEVFGGKRVLLLGESHYEWCNVCWETKGRGARGNDMTCRCVAERACGDRSADNQHWTKIENAVFKYLRDRDDLRRDSWHDVAYANYIQCIVGKLGMRPIKEMWDAAEQPFRRLLEALEPDILIVIGREVWCKLPEEDVKLSPLYSTENWRRRIECCEYKLPHGGTVAAIGVPHTRCGLGEPWAEPIFRALTAGI